MPRSALSNDQLSDVEMELDRTVAQDARAGRANGEAADGGQYCERAAKRTTTYACLHFRIHARSTLRPADGITHAYVLRATAWSWAAAAGRARTGSGAEGPRVLVASLSSQKLAARAATRDQHLLTVGKAG